MIIKEFEPCDLQAFLHLCENFYSSNVTLREHDEKIATATFSRIMDKHENLWGYLMVDADTNMAVGYSLISSYWCNEEGGEVVVLDELYIDTSSRKKGYAKMFMQWLEEKYSWAVAITLEVLTSNKSAQELYSKTGYSPDGYMTYTKKPTK